MTGRRAVGLAVTNAWPPMAAGTGRALQTMLDGVADATVLAPVVAADAAVPDAEGQPAVQTVLRWSGRAGGVGRWRSAMQHVEIVLAPLAYVARRGPVAWTISSQPLFSGVGLWLLRRAAGVPYAVMAHGEEVSAILPQLPGPRLSARARLMRAVLSEASAVVGSSRNAITLVERTGWVSPERLHVVLPAVDVAEFDRAAAALAPESADAGPMLLAVGRLAQTHKGFDMAIRALPPVRRRHPGARLMIAGPDDQTTLRAIAAEAGVADAVEFAGQVSRARLLELYQRCTVFLMPGREVGGAAEGFGVVYLEAAAARKPAIGGLLGGVREALVDGETGLQVDGTRVDEIAAAIVRLLDDPALARRLGEAGRRRVEREFSVEAQRARAAEILATVAAARPTAPRARG